MSYSTTVECPTCGGDVSVSWWTEEHKVHNGIGMQTVARDDYVEVTEGCGCDLSDDDIDRLLDKAEEKASRQRAPSNRNFSPEELYGY